MNDIDPDSWNNVPTCLANAIKSIKSTVIDGDDSLLSY